MIPKNGEVWEFRSEKSWDKMLVSHARRHGYSDCLSVVILDSSMPCMIGSIKECHYWWKDRHCWTRIS